MFEALEVTMVSPSDGPFMDPPGTAGPCTVP